MNINADDSIFCIIDEVNDFMNQVVGRMDHVPASELGLDSRCGMLYVSDTHIVVDLGRDRTLQYYGGFEYVDSEYRTEMGDYVFYSYDDSRVNEHLQEYFASKMDTEETEE